MGGYFCVLLLSLLPMAYPRPKQVRHKPSTEINPSIVNIRISPPFSDSLAGFYVSKIHCNRRVTVPPERANRLPSWYSQRNTTIIRQDIQSDFSLCENFPALKGHYRLCHQDKISMNLRLNNFHSEYPSKSCVSAYPARFSFPPFCVAAVCRIFV